MDKSGAHSYIFAKACGNIGKSFTGSHSHLLFEQKNLYDLWKLLFDCEPPSANENILAQEIEARTLKTLLKQFKDFICCYDKPSEILIKQYALFEADNIKTLSSGETFKLEKEIWNSVQKCTGEDGSALISFYKEELVIKNIVWALRLRFFYKMSKSEILPKLIYVTKTGNLSDPIAHPAIHILEIPLDDFEKWSGWEYKKLINPKIDGKDWEIDPAWIENAAKIKMLKKAVHLFKDYPMSDASLIGWFKIKNFELTCIRTAVESLRLNINPEEAMNAVGILHEGVLNG